jgi:hypothetical protein
VPHWNGTVDTASPAILEECNGDPVSVRDKIMALAPQGANVRVISWEDGKDKARVTVEGPNAKTFLEDTLQARDVSQLLSAHERKGQRG